MLDNFERALACEVSDEGARNVLKGVLMIEQQMRDVLRRNGVEKLPTVGLPFDPATHEALARVETVEVEEGTVVAELEPGYALNGRVVRAAKVSVAVAPQ